MSAFGYKQTFQGVSQNVRFTPESGHADAQERPGLKKRTLDVCLHPDSGHEWLWRGMSAYDPYASFGWFENQGQEPAKNGRSLEPFAMAACGSETGHWANTHLTSVNPKVTFAAFSSAVGFQERGYKEGPIPPVCLFRLDSVQRPVKSLRAREGGRPKTRLNAWENDGVSANPTAAAISAIPRRLYRKRVRPRSRRRRV